MIKLCRECGEQPGIRVIRKSKRIFEQRFICIDCLKEISKSWGKNDRILIIMNRLSDEEYRAICKAHFSGDWSELELEEVR